MQWQAVRDVFVAALEVDDTERDALITRETTNHPDVEREVKRLLRLHEAAGGFLETPEDPKEDEDSLLSGGELVAERFEVVRLIGRGGMAEVYEARDRVLGERVALKVTRSTAIDPAIRTERFQQEVQLARRVSHPGVCRVHDVAFHRRHDGQPLLVFTMELLSGETLAECLRHRPLPREQARSIAMEIATALDAAHTHGILHGDIKPENVMLVPRHDGSTRVVLTDFGLARALGSFAPGLPTTALMGTPAYMAPELFRGSAPSIASDVYAFALLIYRLLSSKDDLWRTTRILSMGSGDTSTLPAGLRELEPNDARVLAKALSPDPAVRFGSATELGSALFPETAVRARRVVWGGLAAIAAVAVLAVAPFAGWLRLSPDGETSDTAPARLLLTTTDNRTGESELDGMTELLRGQLAQSARLEVLPPETVPNVLKEMRQDATTPPDQQKLREIALRREASLVLSSAVSLAGKAYRLDVRLEHIGARPSIVEASWGETFQAADRPQLLDAVRRASLWARSTAGESKAQLRDQDRLPSEITTSSWEALREFARAQQSHQRGDLANAIVYLREAIRLDPEFVSAYARLGDELTSIRQEELAFAAWQRAVELANSRQLTTREALRLRAQFLEETATLGEAEAAFRAYVLHYPSDFDANIYLGMMIAYQGRTEEAIPWLEQAGRLRPTSPSGPVFLVTQLLELERFDEAVTITERLGKTTQPEFAAWLRALIAFTRGDLDQAFAGLEPLRTANDPQWQSRYVTLHGSWLAEAGRFADAEREIADGIAFDVENGLRNSAALKLLHVAQLRERAGDRTASADAVKRAIAQSSDARTLVIAADLFSRLGMIAELRNLLGTLDRQSGLWRVRLAARRVDGAAQGASGRVDLAIETLGEVSRGMRSIEPRGFYTNALIAARRDEEAIAVLGDWVRHPARFYAFPEPESPGPWAASVDQFRAVLDRGGHSVEAETWASRLTAFRAAVNGR